MMRTRTVVVMALALVAACDVSDLDRAGRAQQTTAPLLDAADGLDGADRSCLVVLRSIGRVPNGRGGYETECWPGEGCWAVWHGTLELSDEALDQGGRPVVLYQSGSDPRWWQVEAAPTDSTSGRNLFEFDLTEHTIEDGTSFTSLMHARIQVIPAVLFPDGRRLFDHNRNPGDFDNYVLTYENGWSIDDEPGVCGSVEQRSVLTFSADWTETQHGALVAGGTLVVEYDLARLPQCFGVTVDGVPSWRTIGHAMFQPGGQEVTGQVSEVTEGVDGGLIVVPRDWELEVPDGAEWVELWFETGGEGCDTAWDSDFGANFGFPVQHRRPDGTVAWVGDARVMATRGMCDTDRTAPLSETFVVDSWIMTRAECLWLDVNVRIPGVTDRAELRPEWIEARVTSTRDGGEPSRHWLHFVRREGDAYRYRWEPRRDLDLYYTPWDRIEYEFEFSLDGLSWVGEGVSRVIERDDDWCPRSYWGEERCP